MLLCFHLVPWIYWPLYRIIPETRRCMIQALGLQRCYQLAGETSVTCGFSEEANHSGVQEDRGGKLFLLFGPQESLSNKLTSKPHLKQWLWNWGEWKYFREQECLVLTRQGVECRPFLLLRGCRAPAESGMKGLNGRGLMSAGFVGQQRGVGLLCGPWGLLDRPPRGDDTVSTEF